MQRQRLFLLKRYSETAEPEMLMWQKEANNAAVLSFRQAGGRDASMPAWEQNNCTDKS